MLLKVIATLLIAFYTYNGIMRLDSALPALRAIPAPEGARKLTVAIALILLTLMNGTILGAIWL